MKTYQILFSPASQKTAEDLADVLEDFQQEWFGALLLNKLSDQTQNDSRLDQLQSFDLWQVVLIGDQTPNLQELDRILSQFNEMQFAGDILFDKNMIAYQLDVIEDFDWLAQNRSSFPPLRIGRFFIMQKDEQCAPPPCLIPWRIGASLAFGTGSHATTSMCLQQIEKIHQKGLKTVSAMDVGCGTAILAMGAAELWKGRIKTCYAGDVDQKACVVAKENVIINKLHRKIKVFLGAGFPAYKLKPTEKFDLIVMNILANPLIDLAPDVSRRCHKNARVIVSGLTKEQKNKVVSCYVSHGFVLCNYSIKNGWSQLMFKVKKSPSQSQHKFSRQSKILPYELC